MNPAELSTSEQQGYFAKQGYDVLDQIVAIIHNREVADAAEIEQAIEARYGASEFYDRFVGPMIDEAQRFLGFDEDQESDDEQKQPSPQLIS